MWYGVDNSGAPMFSILVFLAKFGISSGFQIAFVAHTHAFPTLFCTTSLGFCQFISRICAALSPVMAGLNEPAPVLIFTITSAIACVAMLKLETGKFGQGVEAK